jgi:biopolymer transport protein ExbB
MDFIDAQLDMIQQLLHAGGSVLGFILLISIVLWSLIVERILFFRISYPTLQKRWLEQWRQRTDKKSQAARCIRQCMISEAHIAMYKTVPVIRMLVTICPLMGLLGTVTGMIHVFDVMAVTGNGNARAMADGVSQATIPTMAGMVIAIAGLYFSKLIEERVSDESHHLADLLQNH